MKIDEFRLERFLAEYEFSAPHLLCTSDCQSMTISELLAMTDYSQSELGELHLGYTESGGSPVLREKISELYSDLDPDEVIVFAGAEEAIFVFMNVLLSAGDHVIVQYPAYQSLYQIAEAAGCRVSRWMMNEDDDWKPDIEKLKEMIQEDTKAIVINTPHNPTGYHFSYDEFKEIRDIAAGKEITILSDEVYRGLEYNKKDRLPAIAEIYDRGVSIGVMSKAFGLAGLRIGWLISRDKELLKRIMAFKDYTTICSSAPSEFLSTAALTISEDIFRKNIAIIQENLSYLDSFFERYWGAFSWVKPKAGPIAFPSILSGEGSMDFALEAINNSGVLLLPSEIYDFGSRNFRIGFGRRDMKISLEKFEEFLNSR
ncbi:aminotransferase class I/II-fold pyridoxal phosphate-dependent enzyme [Methanoplanus endosymbiosus]|uniref:Aminotransferase class I/II-fold pyridoxal phosphate-dependent enzyme n=1 Tax=Methanoplanus endosymbiosus TaxID=33865 RepID=A0A9E7PRD7_9EURY|nr:aminotransferase class I/II-fold pyridoxal phosphate-dependent enzyme [Methanoplanus endosymbiosus]UUX93591.1 aminotransferase class I/II-fold pyridoxal phosphate-dependent enzyme [Methanoplanus endosymbiosus]